ncbi:MAG: hypothetical protein KAS32_06575 [Candidatus Peribacteraceae bacterium]|nr:hypothetical protein [Candidatus Peribacteraceae bacterium]
MTENEIRLAVLNCESKGIRELLLNESQVTQIWEIYDRTLFTASRLSEAWDISIQCASMRLKRFYVGGYLNRRETSAESGGIEYIYSLPDFKS